ncbi:MAG: hypothetical protein LBS37_06560 [Treponema sp.]|jgi:CRP-like cAMP-binding protein|nr:hypothetical protein [Treponema sp.]
MSYEGIIFLKAIRSNSFSASVEEFLAEISILLKSAERRSAIITAATPDEVLRILSAGK